MEPVRILVLEDNPDDAMLVKEFLSEADPREFSAECTVAGTLSQALALLAKGRFDLVLSDLNLPDETGLETFYRVQNAAPETPVMVMTGVDDMKAGAQAVESGAQDYLVKGHVEPARLVQAVRFALERHHLKEWLVRQTRTDPLTNLQNRRGLAATLDHLASWGGMQVLLADVDDFKAVNDHLGHDAGDAVLKEVARRLCLCLRSTDCAARVGGDEFLMLLPRSTAGEARVVAERVRRMVSESPIDLPSGPLRVTVSIGGASVGQAALDTEGLLARTHEALAQSKSLGKNRVMGEWLQPNPPH